MPLSFRDTHPTKPDYMGYAEFELAGHHFKSWQPANDNAPRQVLIEVYKDGKLVKEATSPMFHPNLFGMDIEDAGRMEDETEKIVKELGLE